MNPFRRNPLPASLVLVLALARPALAVPNVTQVIDGLPQVIAPQQIIVKCDPSVLQTVCTAALSAVGAVLTAVGQAGYNLATLAPGVPLQDALDALRAST